MKEKLEKYLPVGLYKAVCNEKLDTAAEIRLRAGRRAAVRYADCTAELPYEVTPELLNETLNLFCGYSLYAYAEDIARGFVFTDGLRVGIGGRVIFKNGESGGIKTVSSLNIRFSRQIRGCADKLLSHITENGRIRSTMLVSPPMCGKTTLLRDVVRQLGNRGINISVIDERGEIACLDQSGLPANDVGRCTDVLSGCGKAAGVMMALRSLSPELIALDEIGDREDVGAINSAVTGGAAVLCTVHSDNIKSLKSKKYIAPLIEDGLFERIVFLCGRGETAAIYDAGCERIC